MKNKLLLFVFLFCNLYNPISIYFTLLINLLILLFLTKAYKLNFCLNSNITICTSVIFFLSIFIMVLNFNLNTYVLGKYSRVLISSFLIGLICGNISVSLKQIIKSLSFVFLLHIVAVGVQIIYPDISLPMAIFFGFGRDVDVVNDMIFRKLGLSTSYDTAGLIAILAMGLYFFRYYYEGKIVWLLVSLVSLISCIFISRTGMLVGTLLLFILLLYLFFTQHGSKRLVAIIGLTSGMCIVCYMVLPILAATTSFFDYTANVDVSFGNDYTTGTTSGLLGGSHLNAIRSVSPFELILGYGIDPNDVQGMASDIGYVKIIYHVGIVGLLCILWLYFYLFINTFYMNKMFRQKNINVEILSRFFMLYIMIMMVFNYKSLEIYSRGTHDLLLILFYFMCNFSWKNVVDNMKLNC